VARAAVASQIEPFGVGVTWATCSASPFIAQLLLTLASTNATIVALKASRNRSTGAGERSSAKTAVSACAFAIVPGCDLELRVCDPDPQFDIAYKSENETMSKVIFEMSMSLDGFVAGPDDGQEFPLGRDGIKHVFAWYSSGTEKLRGVQPALGANREGPIGLEKLLTDGPFATHIRYRVVHDEAGRTVAK
jgi:hypothetical protein